MSSFSELMEDTPAPALPVQTELPEPPEIPRPGVYRVLRYAAGVWRWELTADPAIRLYWQLKNAGQWPEGAPHAR